MGWAERGGGDDGRAGLLGDTLAASPNKGQWMGLLRGSASLVWALGAFAGGRIANNFSLSAAFLLCGGMFVAAALVALPLQEVKPASNPATARATASAAASPAGQPVAGGMPEPGRAPVRSPVRSQGWLPALEVNS